MTRYISKFLYFIYPEKYKYKTEKQNFPIMKIKENFIHLEILSFFLEKKAKKKIKTGTKKRERMLSVKNKAISFILKRLLLQNLTF